MTKKGRKVGKNKVLLFSLFFLAFLLCGFFVLRIKTNLFEKFLGAYNVKISVIIPVYNTEKYLDKCLESVERQTLENIEIICVNDGSKDNSLEILKKHAEKDNRIKIIDQKNMGVSAARNSGIRAAKGQYITFVDSDDLIKEYTYQSCMEIIKTENPEIFIYGYRTNEDEDVPQNIDISKCNFYDHDNFMRAYYNSHPAVWDKIFKRDFLLKNQIFFNEDIHCAEDYVFTLMALLRAEKIVDCPNRFYYYKIDNESSIVHTTKKQKQMEASIKANKCLIQYFHRFGVYDYDVMFLEEIVKIGRYITEEVKDVNLQSKYAKELLDVY